MSTLFWLSFFFSTPPHNTCATTGTPLLEIRERSETSTAVTTKKIYNSGAWTLQSDSATARGCFSKKEIRGIRQELREAQWKVTQSPIACFAYDPNFTEYLLNGKLRYTHRMCSGKTADFETMEAIELVNKELNEDMPPAPPPPPAPKPTHPPIPPVVMPPAPPVTACRATGTPLFEIHKRADVAMPTSTIAIYSTGAWTFSPIDKDGHAGALTTRCFDKPTLATIRHAVNDVPWDVTLSRIVCRAYSATFTEYYVHGSLEYTARLCGPQRLDDESQASLKIIEAELAKVLPKDEPVVIRDHREPGPVMPTVRDHRAAL